MRFVASTPHCVDAEHPRTQDCSYRIAWSINPHMVIGGVDTKRAVSQHAALIRTVRALGADVLVGRHRTLRGAMNTSILALHEIEC